MLTPPPDQDLPPWFPPATPVPPLLSTSVRRVVWASAMGLGMLVIASFVALAMLIHLEVARPKPAGMYQFTHGWCDIDGVAVLGPLAQAPRTQVYDWGSTKKTLCLVSVGDTQPDDFVSIDVTVNADRDAAKLNYQWSRDHHARTGPWVGDIAGLGSAAFWQIEEFDPSRETYGSLESRELTRLVTVDDNLLIALEWFPARPGKNPPDSIDRLARAAQAVFAACRRAGPPTPSVVSPPLTFERPSIPAVAPAPYRAVDNLCDIVDFDSVGIVKKGTAEHRTDEDVLVTMKCLVEVQESAPLSSSQVQVVATVRRGSDAAPALADQLIGSDGKTISGLGSGAIVRSSGSAAVLMAYDANLTVAVVWYYNGQPGLPSDIQDRLIAVAQSVINGLR